METLNLRGKNQDWIVEKFGQPESASESDEWIYVLSTSLFGLIKKRLYLYFCEKQVIGYFIF